MTDIMNGVVIACSIVGSLGVTAGIVFRDEIAEMAARERMGFYGDKTYLSVVAKDIRASLAHLWDGVRRLVEH